ncbi:MAG: CDP-glucose 4,6-dehydratase [Victivallales bacterium]|nr:CDP-glucose 4,6-dehydratase [Victivallales bacterium]
MFGNVYNHRRVLVTGHSGFKGSHLVAWLLRLGSDVCGLALPPETETSHYTLLDLPIRSEWCDIRDAKNVERIVKDFRPEIVFHLAAQPLVRRSYSDPVETFSTNIAGTVNLLEALRGTEEVKAIVVVSSDKCYRNDESDLAHREDDPLGGYDPYSASKAGQEIVAASFRDSFFNPRGVLLGTARAGNVIGGGDWAADRLIPDLVRSAIAGKVEPLRSPDAVRPWQHVLEPLSGYLTLGQMLYEGSAFAAMGWNFGPDSLDTLTVGEVAAKFKKFFPQVNFRFAPQLDALHESKFLRLDCSKAKKELAWHGVWNAEEAIRRTAQWYRDFYDQGQINTASDLDSYIESAIKGELSWVK